MVSINYAELYQNADQSVINNQPLPPDNYNVVIEAAEYKIAQSGRGMYNVRFSVESGPHAGRKVNNNFVIVDDNPTALGIHFRHMSAMGIPTDWLLQNPDTDQVAQALIGKRCSIRVDVQKNNSDFNEVKSIRPASGAPAGAPAMAPQGQPQVAQQPQGQQFAPPPGYAPQPQGQPQQGGIPQPQFGAPAQQPQFAPPQQQQQQQQQQPPAPQFAPPLQQQQAPVYQQPASPQYDPNQAQQQMPQGYAPQPGQAPQQAQFAPPPQQGQPQYDPNQAPQQGQQQAPPPPF